MNNWHKHWDIDCQAFARRCFKDKANFVQALRQPMQSQQVVLQDIVNLNKNTKFGKQHAFRAITNIKTFQQQVPIRSYDQFSAWIAKEVQQRGGVLAGEPVARWLRTSGSTGESKKIPYTVNWMEKYRVPALGVLWANYIKHAPMMLSHPYATLDMQTVREEVTDFLNGVPYQGITNRNPLLNRSDWHLPWYNSPWFNPEVPSDYDVRMYYRLRYFLDQDLRAILTINPSTLIALRNHLLKNFSQLIKDIYDGTIYGKKGFVPNRALGEQLEKQQTQLHNNPSLSAIWPNLSLISCWTSASAKLYLSQLRQIFPNAKILPFMSCGTEGIVTLPVDDHPITGPLAVNQGFYEFLPAEIDIEQVIASKKGIAALTFDQLQLGKEYHLIMSQANGMCRYAVGDLYKVIDFYNGVPRIEYSRRQGTYHSFTGEKLTEPQLLSVIDVVVKQHSLTSGLFMFCPVWDSPPYYKMLIEVDKSQTQVGLREFLARSVDSLLRKYNEEYDSKRKSERLRGIKLYLVNKGTLDRFQEEEKQQSNAVQYKYKPFQKDITKFNQVLTLGQINYE